MYVECIKTHHTGSMVDHTYGLRKGRVYFVKLNSGHAVFINVRDNVDMWFSMELFRELTNVELLAGGYVKGEGYA